MSLYVWTRALESVASERARQEALREAGRFQYTPASHGVSDLQCFAMLAEELGEVARQTLTQPDDAIAYDTAGSREDLRGELIQVAAIATAWVERLDRAG